MRSALIGSTGFIGGNLARQHPFDEQYHSRNISEIRGKEFDLLVCAGVSAVKWWACKHPEEDRARIDQLLADLGTVKSRETIVISTVDVYPATVGVDEAADCHAANHAYGTNRLYFEEQMQSRFSDPLIVRLPGVFGSGLKKNVIFDLLHDNCLEMINPESSFQYMNAGDLWPWLTRIREAGTSLVNIVSEPVQTQEIIDRFFPGSAAGASPAPRAHYDIRSQFSEQFGGPPGYLIRKEEVFGALGRYIDAVRGGTGA